MPSSESWGDGLFHDAEVISLRLDRAGPTLELAIALDSGTPLLLSFEEVADVDLVCFEKQNVLFDIAAAATSDGCWQVSLESSCGLAGGFRCARMPELEP
jgi:hypothetical protein